MQKLTLSLIGIAALALVGCSNSTPNANVTPKPVNPANSTTPGGPGKKMESSDKVGADGKPADKPADK